MIRTGCMGWSYDDWVGPFYPQRSSQRDFLSLYSLVFDTVEVDSSFYRMPSHEMVDQWKSRTPDDFLFTLKLPGIFTHDRRLLVQQSAVEEFENIAKAFGSKLACVLIMLPPWSRFELLFDQLRDMLDLLGTRIRYAVEFRHQSWFRQEVFKFLSDRNICFVWSINKYTESPAELTSDLIYLRFIGDRKITRFDRIQIDRTETIREWQYRLHSSIEENKIRDAYVFSNNHFAGFAPETINTFRRFAGMGEKDWRRIMAERKAGSQGKGRQTGLDW
ncbi:MAG: DUF72 domain-containing protein [Methanomassiliicoccales archaeon]|nr:DUF72 domain-containing protein [Methanomassiliicoccales archaeon]